MNDPKAQLRGSHRRRLLLCAAVAIVLSGCGSKRAAKPMSELYPPGVVEGSGHVVALNPDLQTLTLQTRGRQVTLWISNKTEYFHGKEKITAAEIKPESDIDFSGWSYGTDVVVKHVDLK